MRNQSAGGVRSSATSTQNATKLFYCAPKHQRSPAVPRPGLSSDRAVRARSTPTLSPPAQAYSRTCSVIQPATLVPNRASSMRRGPSALPPGTRPKAHRRGRLTRLLSRAAGGGLAARTRTRARARAHGVAGAVALRGSFSPDGRRRIRRRWAVRRRASWGRAAIARAVRLPLAGRAAFHEYRANGSYLERQGLWALDGFWRGLARRDG